MTQAAFLNPSDAMVSTHAGTIAGERFQVLDSWRGICALLVALFHFPTASAISQSAFIGSSYLFVDFFFVLSGFVIALNYGDRLAGDWRATGDFLFRLLFSAGLNDASTDFVGGISAQWKH